VVWPSATSSENIAAWRIHARAAMTITSTVAFTFTRTTTITTTG
jgi:hypothetical protein